MRFTLTGVCFFMAVVLACAVALTAILRNESGRLGHNVVLIVLRSNDSEGLSRAFYDDKANLIKYLRKKGVSFMRLAASSPWYPATMASMLTGLNPSEHGAHRAHAHLSESASTVPEVLNACGFESFAVTEEGSLLDSMNILQDFSERQIADPGDGITAFLRFLDRRHESRSFFALIEVDVDAWGGPSSFETALETLFEGMDGERFLEDGVLAVMVSGETDASSIQSDQPFTSFIPFVLAGAPQKVGPGKCLIKPASICAMEKVLLDLALGKGFTIRDAVRTGKPVVTEWAAEPGTVPIGEVNTYPPYFYRSLRFDDNPYHLFTSPAGRFRIFADRKEKAVLDPEQEEILRLRFESYLAERTCLEDLIIPAFAGPLLDRSLAERLGEPWMRNELMGHPLHAVEHFRLAVELGDRGYAALAINEYIAALMLDRNFSEAFYQLAETFATIDPDGARKHYETFLKRFGARAECAGQAEKARRFLGLPPR